jgi:hypothetical protein
MSIFIIKSSDIAACPKKSLSPGHYDSVTGKCTCPDVQEEQLPLRKKQSRAVAEFACPLCKAPAGERCTSQAVSRRQPKELKAPHPERVQLVDPSLAGYRKRGFRSSAEGKAATMSHPRRKVKGWSENEG